MKLRLILAAAALSFAANASHAAEMDCCKDGKCACCAEKKKDEKKPHGDMKH